MGVLEWPYTAGGGGETPLNAPGPPPSSPCNVQLNAENLLSRKSLRQCHIALLCRSPCEGGPCQAATGKLHILSPTYP